MRRLLMIALLVLPAACALLPATGQRFVVFFQGSATDVDDSATQIVAAAAHYAAAHPDQAVSVAGFADPYGTADVNTLIVRGRTDSVTKALVTDGIPATRIATREVGKVEFALNSQESRRVVITVGSP